MVELTDEAVALAKRELTNEWRAGPDLPDDLLDALPALQAAGLVERRFRDSGPAHMRGTSDGITISLSACWHFRLSEAAQETADGQS